MNQSAVNPVQPAPLPLGKAFLESAADAIKPLHHDAAGLQALVESLTDIDMAADMSETIEMLKSAMAETGWAEAHDAARVALNNACEVATAHPALADYARTVEQMRDGTEPFEVLIEEIADDALKEMLKPVGEYHLRHATAFSNLAELSPQSLSKPAATAALAFDELFGEPAPQEVKPASTAPAPAKSPPMSQASSRRSFRAAATEALPAMVSAGRHTHDATCGHINPFEKTLRGRNTGAAPSYASSSGGMTPSDHLCGSACHHGPVAGHTHSHAHSHGPLAERMTATAEAIRLSGRNWRMGTAATSIALGAYWLQNLGPDLKRLKPEQNRQITESDWAEVIATQWMRAYGRSHNRSE